MLELMALGPASQRLRKTLDSTTPIWLGRAPGASEVEDTDGWEIPWDLQISRVHARLRPIDEGLEITVHTAARNPVFHQGEEHRGTFRVRTHEHFIIGETLFQVEDSILPSNSPEQAPADMTHYTIEDLRQASFPDADKRLEVLANLQHVIRGATDDQSLFSRLVLLVLEGIDHADAAAIVHVEESGAAQPRFLVDHWDSRDATTSHFRPSRTLIHEAIERQQSVRCLWGREEIDPEYTVTEDLDWAFCTPIPGEAMAGWALYVAGRAHGAGSVSDLRPDMKFAELITAVLGALRDVQRLEARQSSLSRFFSPRALPLLTSAQGEEALSPREAEVTVLFCDLRGFSLEAEKSSHELLPFFARISRALDIMTDGIHRYQGVVGDFQGDAALAFWGWPLDQPDAAAAACRTALYIQDQFAQARRDSRHLLANLRFGIGIASGPAVAGKLGSTGRFKVGVFGPVVNLAARLESITRRLSAPILVDETTVHQVQHQKIDGIRFRKLVNILPYGLEQPLVVSEVLAPYSESVHEALSLTDVDIAGYEAALDAFSAGSWEESIALLHEVPHWDQGKDFLTSFILGYQRRAPQDWDGVIRLTEK